VGKKYITCDVARFGSDKTVIGIWDGLKVVLYAFHGLSVTETSNKVREFQASYGISNTNTIADEDGVGAE
jgi:phage terminase large subunit